MPTSEPSWEDTTDVAPSPTWDDTSESVPGIKLSPYEEAKLKGADEGPFTGYAPTSPQREEKMREAGELYKSLLEAPVSTRGETTPWDVMAGLGLLKAAIQNPATAPIAKVAAVPVEFAASQVTPANAALAGLAGIPAVAPFVKAGFAGMGIHGAFESMLRARETQTPEDIAQAIVATGGAVGLLGAMGGKAKPPIISKATESILPKSAKALEETSTTKGEEYAIQERCAEALPMDASSTVGEEVGARVPEPEKPALPQAGKEEVPHAEEGPQRVLLEAKPPRTSPEGAAEAPPLEAVSASEAQAKPAEGSQLPAGEPQPAISETTTVPEKTQAAWPWPKESQWTLPRLREITAQERANRAKFLGLKKPDGSWETAPAKIAEAAKKRFAEAQPKPPEIIGMGGAVPSELSAGSGGDIYGIAQRVRESRAQAGQVPEIQPGQGISWQETIARGRQALAKDPFAADKAAEAFTKNKAISEAAIEVTRAKGEEMFQIARNVEEKFGTESPEYLAAMEAGFKWDKVSKEMQTEWHKAGQAQQGATELDTGDVIELERAYHYATDKPFTPQQRIKAEEVAGKVRETRQQQAEAFTKLTTTIDKELAGTKVKTPVDATDARNTFAQFAKGSKFSPEQIKTIWEWTKKAYLSKGDRNLEEIAQAVSDDLGLAKTDVLRALAEPKGSRKLTNEAYLRQARARQAVDAAKNWLGNAAMPGWERFLRKVPRAFFMAKVFGHGTVGMVTHAGIMMFDPAAAKVYWPEFFRQYKLLVSAGYHEKMMQRLQADPYFVTARRAGLANDPFRYQDDYQNPKLASWVSKWGLAGNRGFDSLKLVRQARWNQIWDSLPDEMRTPEMAHLVAIDVNHATGITMGNPIGKAAEAAAVVAFAPKLEMSRWAWAIGDPVKAGKIFADWKNASPEERLFAMAQLKQKARIAGTYFGLLALNQSILSASGSDQKINFTNPRRGDFLAFKIAGQNVSVISPMLHMVGLFARLWRDARGERRGLEATEGRGEAMGADIWGYARGKLSPFMSPIVDFATQQTFDQRPMPFSHDKTPAWLRRQGKGRWTWPEYLIETGAPIPASEAIREVWKSQGMNESEMDLAAKALSVFVITGGTGVRLSEDKHLVTPTAK